MPDLTQPGPLAWTCHECQLPIENGQGALSASRSSIWDDFATWRAHHYTCQPDEGYDIDVEQIRTQDDVIRWTCHLMAKSWFAGSNWRGVLALTASAPGVPA